MKCCFSVADADPVADDPVANDMAVKAVEVNAQQSMRVAGCLHLLLGRALVILVGLYADGIAVEV